MPEAEVEQSEAWVVYCDVPVAVPNDRPFTIGRSGDLAIGEDNLQVHRQLLELSMQGRWWWLRNVGSHVIVGVADAQGTCRTRLGPGGLVALVCEATTVSFDADRTHFEFEIRVDTRPPGASHESARATSAALTTIARRVALSVAQRMLVLALAEPTLRQAEPRKITLPKNREVTRRLGITKPQFDNRLDEVCRKFTAAGVRGLHGGPGDLASQRRYELVACVLNSGFVTAKDLVDLDAPGHVVGS